MRVLDLHVRPQLAIPFCREKKCVCAWELMADVALALNPRTQKHGYSPPLQTPRNRHSTLQSACESNNGGKELRPCPFELWEGYRSPSCMDPKPKGADLPGIHFAKPQTTRGILSQRTGAHAPYPETEPLTQPGIRCPLKRNAQQCSWTLVTLLCKACPGHEMNSSRCP